MSQPQEHRKLPGRGNRREGGLIVGTVRQSRLWLGHDHLLLVDSTLVAQDLKRFYFRDIQAITVRKTHTGRTWNLVLTGLIALCGLWASLISDDVGRVVLFCIAVVFGGILLINSLFGPTCECQLQTAVQRERLPSLGRLRTARKVLALLRPHLELAQGTLTAEAAREHAAAVAIAPTAHAPRRSGTEPEVRPYRGSFHTLLFALLLVDGLLNFTAVFANSLPLALLQLAVLFGVVLTLVAALIKQQDTDLSTAVRNATWAALGYLGALSVHGFIMHMVHSIQRPGEIQNEYAALKHFASLDPFEHTWLLVSLVVWGCCATLIGLVGAVLLSRFNRDREQATALAAVTPPPIQQSAVSGQQSAVSGERTAPPPPIPHSAPPPPIPHSPFPIPHSDPPPHG
ncbi:MAG: hypothetical protein RL514_2878 [Verrucomicrobiota bacterium]|jgi:hypothetical protein